MLAVEEISETECRTVQQEIELYNVTPAEEGKGESGKARNGKNGRRRVRREEKGRGKARKERNGREEAGEVANDGRPKQLLTRAISGIESNIFSSSETLCFVFNQFRDALLPWRKFSWENFSLGADK